MRRLINLIKNNRYADTGVLIPDPNDLPKLPPSLTRLVIRGSCKLKSVKCLENLNDECKIYVPGKGCEGLEIPERMTNVSR